MIAARKKTKKTQRRFRSARFRFTFVFLQRAQSRKRNTMLHALTNVVRKPLVFSSETRLLHVRVV